MRRWTIVAARVLLVVFEIAITLISLLPLAREPIRTRVNAALAGVFLGRITIESIDELDFHGVRGVRATVVDPEGIVVIRGASIDGAIDPWSALWALARSEPLVIDRARIGYADVSLAQAPDGSVRIANAFRPRTTANKNTTSSTKSTFRMRIDAIAIDRAWTHGRFGAQWVDADAEAVRAVLVVEPELVRVDGTLGVRGRAMPRALDPVGRARFALTYDEVLRLRAAFDGRADTLAVHAGGGIDDERAFASARVDPSEVQPLPDRISAWGRARGSFGGGGPWDFDVFGASRAMTAGILARTENGVLHAHARGTGEGVIAEVDADLRGNVIDANAGVEIADVATLAKRFDDATTWKGAAHVEANGHLDLDARRIDAHAMIASRGASRDGDVRATTLAADADVKGTLDDPAIDLRAHAEGVAIARAKIASLVLAAKGRARSATVRAHFVAAEPIDLEARGGLVDDGIAFDRIAIDASRERIANGAFRWQNGRGKARLAVGPLEIARARAWFGADEPVSGRVGVAAEIGFTASTVEGFAVVDANAIEWNNAIHGLHGRLDVTSIGKRRWSVSLRARSSAGWVAADTTDLAPAGSPFAPSSWVRATGTVHAATTLDLSLLPWPAPAHGIAAVTVDAARPDPGAPPSVDIAARATGLRAEIGAASIEGDIDLVGNVDASGRASVDVDARANKGTILATARIVAPVPWAEITREGRLPSIDRLRETPIETLDAAVPWGDAKRVCKLAGQTCSGQLGMIVEATGSLGNPHAKLSAVVADFRGSFVPVAGAVDASVGGTWDGANGVLAIDATAGQGSHRGALQAKAVLDASDRSRWTASIRSTLDDFPLRTTDDLMTTRMRGRVSGTIALDGWHRDARLRSDLSIAQLEVEDVKTDAVRVKASYDGSAFVLDAGFDGDGTASVRIASRAAWGAALAPTVDASQIDVGLKAQRFRLKTLSGLIPGSVGEIDGRLDADASASVVLATAHVDARGWAKVRSGTFGSSELGQLDDITIDAAMHENGILRLDDLRARSGAGWLHASGWTRIPNGILEEAKLELDVAKARPFPLTLGGAHLGDAWGRIEASVKASAGKLAAAIDVPSLHVLVPDASAHDLVDLDPSPRIAVGVRRNGKLVPLSLTPPAEKKESRAATPVGIDVQLGNDVHVEQGETLRARLVGRPHVEIDGAGRVRVTGQVVVVEGTMDVSGKRFRIDRATATFTGDPGNPMLFATASWDAPDGSKIHADYSGTVANGKITLRSEPAHTHDEIVALLLFGTTSGPTGGGPSTDKTATAIGTGASFATQPLNKALRELTTLDLRTRVDTSAANPKTEIEVQLARDIAASVAYVVGVPPPGTNPDKYWLTVAWRLSARWTADATVGDRGSSIFELTWHYRY